MDARRTCDECGEEMELRGAYRGAVSRQCPGCGFLQEVRLPAGVLG